MNHPVPEEQISAYFDGEVSPDERGEIERLLESSSELRQQLDETAKLSALLHSFPRESAPRELAANVQKQVNAAAHPAPAQSPATATTRRSLRREWTAFGAGMVATIASLLMLVTFNQSPVSRDSSVALQSVSERNSLAIQPTPVAQRELAEADSKSTNANLEEEVLRPSEQPKRSLARPQITSFDGIKLDFATQADSVAKLNEEENLAQNSVPTTGNYVFADAISNSIQPQSQNDFLSFLVNGDVVVSKVADPNNTVAVVEFTVVDIERGSNELKILFKKRLLQQVDNLDDTSPVNPGDVEDRPENLRLATTKNDRNKKRGASRQDEFQVFFARAPGDQLAGTIDDLVKNHPDIFRDWTPQPPIELPVASQPATEGIVAENQATDPLSRNLNKDLKSLSDETTAVNAEAEMAVSVLMARNGSVNSSGDLNLIANNATPPLSVSSSSIGNTPNPERKTDLGKRTTASVAPNPVGAAPFNQVNGNNARNFGNSGQGYFRVSRQNMPHVALQQALPAQNNGAPLVANSMMNSNAVGLGGLSSSMGRNAMVHTNNDSRNSRLVRMLFVLKSGQTTSSPSP